MPSGMFKKEPLFSTDHGQYAPHLGKSTRHYPLVQSSMCRPIQKQFNKAFPSATSKLHDFPGQHANTEDDVWGALGACRHHLH